MVKSYILLTKDTLGVNKEKMNILRRKQIRDMEVPFAGEEILTSNKKKKLNEVLQIMTNVIFHLYISKTF